MATETSSAGEYLLINLDGETHNLIIRVRDGSGKLDQTQLAQLTGATIKAWMTAWKAVSLDAPEIFLDKTPCEKLGIEPSNTDPYVTVFNKANYGLSLTVHSNDNGGGAVKCAKAYYQALKTFQEAAPQYFNMEAVQPKSKTEQQQIKEQANKTIEPDFSKAPSISQAPSVGNTMTAGAKVGSLPTTGNPFIRGTRDVNIPGVIAIEGGKTDSPNFNTFAKIATMPFHWSDVQDYQDGSFVAYRITGELSVDMFNEQLQIKIPTEHNRTININRRGGEHDYEWKGLRDKLALDEEKLAVGQRGFVNAAYVVLKISNSGDKQYKNFYGLYRAPEQEQKAQAG